MDQRSSELNQTEETVPTTTNTTESVTGSVRPATSAAAANSEREIVRDLQKISGSDGDDSDETDSDSSALLTTGGEVAAAAVATTDDPDQIKDQIEQTRNQMSETIDAIQEKLSFSNITEQVKEQVSEQINSAVETAKDAVYGATIGKAGNFMQNVSKSLSNVSESMGDAGTYVVRTARTNPLPLALIGVGVGMLLFQGKGGSSKKRHLSSGRRYEEYGDGGVGVGRGSKGERQESSTLRQFADTSGKALGSARDTVTNAAGTAYEGVSSAASTAYEGVTDAASSAYEGVTSFASSTGEQITTVARKGYNQYERTLEENPLAIGAIALALGAVVGLALPTTEYENQWMGEYKENLVQTVEDQAREALGKVQEVAGEAVKTVREQAQGQANG